MNNSISLKYSIIANVVLGLAFIIALVYSLRSYSPMSNTGSPMKAETAKNSSCTDEVDDMKLRECTSADREKIETEFEKLHEKILADIQPERKNDYIASDKGWRSYLESQCTLEKNVNEGGTFEPIAYNLCVTELTSARIENLKDLQVLY